MPPLDKDVSLTYCIFACVMLLLAGTLPILITRTRRTEIVFPRSSLSRIRLGLMLEAGALLIAALLGQHRLLHSIACGMGIAGGPVMLMGLIPLVRQTGTRQKR